MTEDTAVISEPSFDGGGVTWAALLGGWIEFAKSAVALPDDEAGRAMRGSVADIIGLQAVWFALQHLDELDADERALGIDRAEVLIDRHAKAVKERWRGGDLLGDYPGELPGELSALIEDARSALAKSQAG